VDPQIYRIFSSSPAFSRVFSPLPLGDFFQKRGISIKNRLSPKFSSSKYKAPPLLSCAPPFLSQVLTVFAMAFLKLSLVAKNAIPSPCKEGFPLGEEEKFFLFAKPSSHHFRFVIYLSFLGLPSAATRLKVSFAISL